MLVAACSRSKDIFTARTYHRMVSKYNVLFNGEQALLKAQNTLESSHQEDFNQILPVFITGTEQAVSSVKPDLEKAIEKGTKSISEHSMMIENDQKNTYIDDSYLLIGKARYYDRDYLKALETFNYIIQEFDDDDIRLEAKYWAARTESALDNYVSAKDRFDDLYRDPDLPGHLKDDAFAAYAQLEINQGRKLNAYQLITQAIERADEKEQELRWLYIAAQLQEALGNDYEASRLYRRVIKKGPPYELLFNAQLSRARSYDVDLQDPNDVYDELEKMLADEKNFDNRDKIYYVMAQVANKLDDERQVVFYLNQSIRTSTKNKEQKALSYLWLAELNFDYKEYQTAQAYYDSTFQTLPPSHPKYKRVKALKESLGKLVANINTIELQDSLQNLAGMSQKQRMAVVEKIIDDLKEAEEEERLKAQRAEMGQLAFNTGGGNQGPAAMAGTGSASQEFYFYSPNLRSSGMAAFTQRWGNRKLADNWRRKNQQSQPTAAANNASEGDGAATTGDGQGGADATLPPKYDPKTYLANIPDSADAMQKSHELIQTALYDNGMIYKEEIQDYLAAEQSLLDILKRYPNYDDKVRVWYTLYRVFVLADNKKEAEKYKSLILSNYPDSEFAFLILNEGKEKEEVDQSVVNKLYTQAYLSFENKLYASSLNQSTEGFDKYPETSFGPMFLLLKAINLGYMGKTDDFKKTLQMVVSRYPKSEQATKASEMLGQLAPEQAEEEGEQTSKVQYRSDFSTMHRYVVIFPNKKVSGNDITIKLTDFNKKYYPNDRLRAKAIMLGTSKQLVTVSGLPNSKRAEQYLQTIINESALQVELNGVDFQQFVISNANFSTFYTNQDTEGYLKFYKENYK